MKKLLFVSLLFLTACTGVRTPSINLTPIDAAHITRKSESCSYYLLGFIGPFGDNSLIDAARGGKMSKVLYYDSSYEYYVLFGRTCNRAYGF